jgi:hypothetical protein
MRLSALALLGLVRSVASLLDLDHARRQISLTLAQIVLLRRDMLSDSPS